jgi:dipeptidase D
MFPKMRFIILIALLLAACQPAAPTPPSSSAPLAPAPSSMSPAPVHSGTAPTPTAAPSSTGKIPLKDALNTLNPPAVWLNFYNLTQVPRPSHHEEKVSAFLAKFGRDLGLETIVDEVGNVIIRKPATPGMENRHGVILQAHMDMVPQKTPDKVHDFEKDPIQAYVEGGWVKADRTTLGGDDGIGVAIIMTLLQAKDIAHGPIEALFTVNEEDGFTGVNNLKANVLRGDYYINLDWETEGGFCVSSAGGVYMDATATYSEDATPANVAAYQVTVKGLQGGHSGVDINRGRGSASRLLTRWLWAATTKFDVRVASVAGGDRYNAIPREASTIVTVLKAQADVLLAFVREFEATVKRELAAAEPSLSVVAAPADLPAKVMEPKAQRAMISAIYGSVNGVLRMSDSVPGLVETSTSMGIWQAGNGQWKVGCYVRSAVDSARDDTAQKLASVFGLAGAQVSIHDPYSGWPPNANSSLLKLMKDVYRQKFGKDAEVVAVHAGLETSVVGVKYPQMDMISIGPTLIDVHSPDERLEVASVRKVYDLLVETLKQIPVK